MLVSTKVSLINMLHLHKSTSIDLRGGGGGGGRGIAFSLSKGTITSCISKKCGIFNLPQQVLSGIVGFWVCLAVVLSSSKNKKKL